MEDKIAIIENIELFQRSHTNNSISDVTHRNKKPSALFGVFDGHCGVDCAQYVSKHLPMYIIQHPAFNKDNNVTAFTESFEVINEQFTKKSKKELLRSGCTSCVAVLGAEADKFSTLDVAWCGDSRFGLVRDGKLVFITDEHKPDSLSEKNRILNAGGSVTFTSGAWRVDSSLSVSRSFGKRFFDLV